MNNNTNRLHLLSLGLMIIIAVLYFTFSQETLRAAVNVVPNKIEGVGLLKPVADQNNTQSSSNTYPKVSPDGSRILFLKSGSGQAGLKELWTMNTDGTKMEALVKGNILGVSNSFEWSPFADFRNNNRYIFYITRKEIPVQKKITRTINTLNVVSQDGRYVKELTSISESAVFPRWISANEIAYLDQSDGNKLKIVNTNGDRINKTGREIALVYSEYRDNALDRGVIKSITFDGTVQSLTSHNENGAFPVLSPDKTKVSYISFGFTGQKIMVMNIDGNKKTQVGIGGEHAWSFDSTKIAYNDVKENHGNIVASDVYIVNADGSNNKKVKIETGSGSAINPQWFPDGRSIVFSYSDKGVGTIGVQSLDIAIQDGSPITVNACREITGGGRYALGKNISSTQNACIFIHDTADVVLDCQGHSIVGVDENYAINVKNTNGFSIKNCSLSSSKKVDSSDNIQHMLRIEDSSNGSLTDSTIGGTYATIASSNEIKIKNNKFSTAELQIYRSHFVTIDGNNFLSDILNIGESLTLQEGSNNTVENNYIDGRSDGIFRGSSSSSNIGADDNIVLKDERSDLIRNNVLKNTWDSAIENSGYLYDTKVINNKIENAGVSGIGGWYWSSLRGNTISGNTVTNSPALFVYFRAYDLRPNEEYVYFKDNHFESNKLISQRTDGAMDPEHSTSIYIHAPVGKGGVPFYPGFTDEDILASNNTFKNNDFGTFLKAPLLDPVGMIVDGGGNICSLPTESNYPLRCAQQ